MPQRSIAAAVQVDDGHQVNMAAFEPDVRDVSGPHLVRKPNDLVSEQIGVLGVLPVRYLLPGDLMPILLQPKGDLAVPEERNLAQDVQDSAQ